jgi:hypothetical protein
MRTPLLVLLTFAYAATATAIEYERRLVPIAVGLAPGAYGTVWTTRAVAVEETVNGVEIVGDMSLDLPPGVGGSRPYNIGLLTTDHEPPGAILHVPKEFATRIHVSSVLMQHGAGERQEIAIPVVPEREFVDHTLYFAPLTRRTDRRLHLRVYSLDVERATAAVRVRIQAPVLLRSWTFIYDAVHPLDVEQKVTSSVENEDLLPLRPYAFEMLLDPLLADIPPDTPLAVSILPADEGLHIWGILSETDNATQRVRLTLPQ